MARSTGKPTPRTPEQRAETRKAVEARVKAAPLYERARVKALQGKAK